MISVNKTTFACIIRSRAISTIEYYVILLASMFN